MLAQRLRSGCDLDHRRLLKKDARVRLRSHLMGCSQEFLHEPYMKLTSGRSPRNLDRAAGGAGRGEINAPAAFLRDRRRLVDSRLRLDPVAGRISRLERTGEQMIGVAHRHTDAKKWHVLCTRPLIQEERDELDRFAGRAYSITSSASICIEIGTSIPSALAVFMLMTSSNLVGCMTGRSASFAPRRILST